MVWSVYAFMLLPLYRLFPAPEGCWSSRPGVGWLPGPALAGCVLRAVSGLCVHPAYLEGLTSAGQEGQCGFKWLADCHWLEMLSPIQVVFPQQHLLLLKHRRCPVCAQNPEGGHGTRDRMGVSWGIRIGWLFGYTVFEILTLIVIIQLCTFFQNSLNYETKIEFYSIKLIFKKAL